MGASNYFNLSEDPYAALVQVATVQNAVKTATSGSTSSASTGAGSDVTGAATQQMNDVRNAGRASSMQTGLTGNLLSGMSGFEEDPYMTSKLLLGQ